MGEDIEDQAGETRKPRSPAIAKAGAILEAISQGDGRPLGVSELGRRIGVAKSSVAAICDTLVEIELLHRTDRGFQLGAKLAEYGAVYLGTVDLVDSFNRAARDVADVLDETIQLAVLRNDLDVVYMAREYGDHPIRVASEVGQALPANCTGAGKALLAALDPAEFERRLDRVGELKPLTERSITDRDVLLRELAAIRERGYSLDDEETVAGVYCVSMATPGIDPPSRMFAVSCTFLKARRGEADVDGMVGTLSTLSDRICKELGLRWSRAPRPRPSLTPG